MHITIVLIYEKNIDKSIILSKEQTVAKQVKKISSHYFNFNRESFITIYYFIMLLKPNLQVIVLSTLLAISFSLNSVAYNKKSNEPLLLTTVVKIGPKNIDQTSISTFPLHFGSFSQGSKVVLGVKEMFWKGSNLAETKGWKSYLTTKGQQHFIEIQMFDKRWNWVLELLVMKIQNLAGMIILPDKQIVLEKQSQSSQVALTFENSNIQEQNDLTIAEPSLKELSEKMRPFLLLTGLTRKENCEDGSDLEINLEVVGYNTTHIVMKNKFRGIKVISLTLLVFREYQLLKHFILLRTFSQNSQNQTKRNLPTDFISSFRLVESKGKLDKYEEKVYQNSDKNMFQLLKISCAGYWSFQREKCINKCANVYNLGDMKLCLAEARNLGDDCGDDYQLDWGSCGPSYEVVPCPGSITNCVTCILTYSNGQTSCQTCVTGYYATHSGICQTCPLGCVTCQMLWWSVSCGSCVTNFQLKGWIVKRCECNSNQYVNATVPECVNCPTGCSSCIDNTQCTGCIQGYYMNGLLCSPCMPVCQTCDAGTTCTSCIHNLIVSGTTCVCPGAQVLDPNTTTCITCVSHDPNCLTCDYNPPGINPISPTPIVCTVAAIGYFVSGGVATQCGAYCEYCTSPTVCTGCQTTFFLSAGSCICSPLPLFLNNIVPPYCQNCSVTIPGCQTCVRNTATECSTCMNKYYPSTPGPSTTACLACPPACATCSSFSNCGSCEVWAQQSGSDCLCPSLSSTYLNAAGDGCLACNLVIASCATCVSALTTTCSACDPGFSVSANNLECMACPLNCVICSSTTVCTTCTLGYTWNGVQCNCDGTCVACKAASGGACSACTTPPLVCTGCAAGYYLFNSTCPPCMIECESCVDGSTCIGCNGLFILGTDQQCHCNNTGAMYLSINASTCEPCGTVVVDCLDCTELANGTFCNACTAGKYYNTTIRTCQICDNPCQTCTGIATNCNTCDPTYILTNTSCVCDSANQFFYSSATLGCLVCPSLIPNCATCSANVTNPTSTDCTTCSDPYYTVGFNTCVMCDVKCSSCTGPSACLSCATNLVILGGAPGTCSCNTTADPTLYYYSATNQCYVCLNFLSNCLSCQPSPLACLTCQNGTYLNGTICLTCDGSCQTCDVNGCLSCPLGYTLNGTVCSCPSDCLACQVTSQNCINCTLDNAGITTQCFSCMPGHELAADGINCNPCPTGCATCSGGGVCTTCINSFILKGTVCECDNALSIYFSGVSCQLCSTIFYGCSVCNYDGSVTTCTTCTDGMYQNGTVCSFCDSSCLTCSSETVCTSCDAGLTLVAGACTCDTACTDCGTNSTQCSACISTIYGTFGQCTACNPTFYLDATFNCQPCPGACVLCDSTGACTSCTPTLEVINGTCGCNADKSLVLNTANNQCEPCDFYYPYCSTCTANASILIGYECSGCAQGYYWSVNETCELEVCGDGIVTPSEACDDYNSVKDDGCFLCQVEEFYNCTGSPSLCTVITDFSITYDSTEVSTTVCNEVTFFFRVNPAFPSFDNADFSLMYAFKSYAKIDYIDDSFIYYKGMVGYKFEYTGNIVGARVKFYFTPKLMNVPDVAYVPLYPVKFNITDSINSVKLKYRENDVCKAKEAVNTYIDTAEYASYGVLILSALPCKIVGLELFGVLQMSFLSLGSMDQLNPVMSSFTKLSSTNGFKFNVDKNEPTNTRRLQTSALTPNRVQTIGYASNFIRNCNFMLILTAAIMVVAFFLYFLTCCCKNCCPCLYSVARRIFKELLLTIILFNCFNFAYCVGLHFAYADKSDSLYGWGTLAAIASLVIPLMMVIVLQCSEEQGFGQYKDKLKEGKIEKAYFVITILYRIGVGFYMATMNEDSLSTLIVLGISIIFLLYNLINLPFTKAYHNYRACICHFSQFIILYIAMYYRTMTDGTNTDQIDSTISPVYFELGVLGIAIIVSLIVLVVEICIWIGEIREWCNEDNGEKVVQNETESNEDNVVKAQEIGSEQMEIYKMFA